MRTQWTAKGNRDAGSSCSCDRGLHQYLRNFGGVLNPPNHPPRYATEPNCITDMADHETKTQLQTDRCFFDYADSLCVSGYIFYRLTPRNTVLPAKLTVPQPVKKFPTFYGSRTFITAFTTARHLSLSWASSIQSIPLHTTSWRSILILFSHLRLGLPSGLFPSCFPTKTLYAPLVSHVRFFKFRSKTTLLYPYLRICFSLVRQPTFSGKN